MDLLPSLAPLVRRDLSTLVYLGAPLRFFHYLLGWQTPLSIGNIDACFGEDMSRFGGHNVLIFMHYAKLS